jgi:TadE-like protein
MSEHGVRGGRGASGARGGRGASGARGGRGASDRGQSTVELALTFPFVCLALLGVVQVGLVAHDWILVTHAAREAARAAAVSADVSTPRTAALAGGGLEAGRLIVRVDGRAGVGSRVRVSVDYDEPTDLPLVGVLVPDVHLRSEATMRVES